MKKIIASIAALAVAATMATSAFAATVGYTPWNGEATTGSTIEVAAWSGAWVDITLEEGEELEAIKFEVTSANAATKWDDYEMFIFNGAAAKGDYGYETGVMAETEYEFTYDVEEIIAEMGETIYKADENKYGFNIQAGQDDIVVNVVPVMAEADEPADDVEEFVVPEEYVGDNVVYLVGEAEKNENGPFNDKVADLATYTAVKFTVSLSDAEVDAGTWVGGGVGFNSNSTSWESHEWSCQDGVKELTFVKVSDGVYEVTFAREDGASIFAADDTYAQVWLQDWSTGNAKLLGVTLIKSADADEPTDEPVEDEPVEDEPSEETPVTGATAGLALAAVALAGAAVVATKKNK